MTLYHSKRGQTISAQKTFREYLAISSVWLGIFGIPLIAILTPLTDAPQPPCCLIWWVFCLLMALSARFGAGKSTSSKICTWAFVGIVLNLTILIGGALSIHAAYQRPHLVYRMVCGSNLHALWSAMTNYSDQNDTYPPPDQWCDVLSRDLYSEHVFICKSAQKKDKGLCHYAINPDCEPNSPPDIVLLFETRGGWNRYGGPELLTFDNHQGKGANVLFNDGHFEFIRPKDVGRLKWKADESKAKAPN